MQEVSPLDDADWLRQRYEIERQSSPAIAGMLGTTPARVIRALRRHGIPVRSGAEVWRDPDYRRSLVQKRREAWTPERRAQRSEQMKGDPTGQLARARERLQTDEARARMREATRRSWQDPEARANRLAGMARPETRQRMSAARRAYWTEHPDEAQQSLRRMRSRVKGGHYLSALEARVITALNGLRAWYRIHEPVGPYAVDIFVRGTPHVLLDADDHSRHHVGAWVYVVECDGSYWHGQRPEHDAARDAYMASHGFPVVRIAEDATDEQIVALLRDWS